MVEDTGLLSLQITVKKWSQGFESLFLRQNFIALLGSNPLLMRTRT